MPIGPKSMRRVNLSVPKLPSLAVVPLVPSLVWRQAGRLVWRVALDYELFPSEAGDAPSFLDPVVAHLETCETNGNWVENLQVDAVQWRAESSAGGVGAWLRGSGGQLRSGAELPPRLLEKLSRWGWCLAERERGAA